MIEQAILVFALLLCSFGILILIIGGYQMIRKNRNLRSPWTADQEVRLRKVKNDAKRYAELVEHFRVVNQDSRVGRVLNLKGEVLHNGYEIIEGEEVRKIIEKPL